MAFRTYSSLVLRSSAKSDAGRCGGGGADSALTLEAGVTAVPVSAFYVSDAPSNYLRLCFCKRDSVLDEAVERMGRWLDAACRTAA